MGLYQAVNGLDGVQRLSDGVFIPAASGNSDWRAYQAWLSDGNSPDPAPGPTPDDLLASKLAAGLQIISTGTAALNGTYAIDAGAQTEITGIISLIGAGIGMPQEPLPWADINGAPNNFAGADFKNFAKAVSLYMLGLRSTWNALRAGQQANWPDQPVAIP